MKFEKHAVDGIHRVEDAFVNWYIVDDGGQLTIVDTGLPSSWKSMHQALGQIGRSPSDIQAVVLTHAHFDHMGFAERARRELGVPVLAHELEVPVTKSPWNYDHERARLPYFFRYPRFIGVFAAMGAAGALWTKGAKKVQTYGSEDRLDVPGRPKVIFTPGHTYGHCSLHFPDRGAVIAGDAVVTLNPYTGHAGPQIVSGAATADSAQALASLGAIAATGAQSVLTGHGPVWREGAPAAVERALAAGPS